MAPRKVENGESFYQAAYAASEGADAPDEEDSRYVKIAREAAKAQDIEGITRRFVQQYKLEQSRVLDVGAGRGYLQDIVADYTGLDISPSARRFFHKKFVLGSATAMPFADSEFGAAWSIWVLEHVPNPEHALLEIRRVVKDGGYVLLLPAFNCGEWLADGHLVRPYADFDWKGKLFKASVPLLLEAEGRALPVIRAARWAQWGVSGGKPMKYRYRLLKPNYKEYWMNDSDALNWLDYFETAMWFESRGDECVNCGSMTERLSVRTEPLIIRIHKGATQARR